MQLDSVLIRTSSPVEVRRLCRAGGEVWQEYGQLEARAANGTGGAGGIRWRYALVKVPAAAAIRLGLVRPGAELSAIAEPMSASAPASAPENLPALPAVLPAAAAPAGGRSAARRERKRAGSASAAS